MSETVSVEEYDGIYSQSQSRPSNQGTRSGSPTISMEERAEQLSPIEHVFRGYSTSEETLDGLGDEPVPGPPPATPTSLSKTRQIRLSDLFEPSVLGSGVAPEVIEIDTKGKINETTTELVTKQLSRREAGPGVPSVESSSPLIPLSASRLPEGWVRRSWELADEAERPNSRERKLKLKVSRGALSKSRRQTGGTSGASFDSHRLSSELSRSDDASPNNVEGLEGLERHSFITNTPPAPPPSQCCGEFANQASRTTQKPAVPNEILTLLSSRSRVNGKALRRLQKRFPDLESRLGELHLQMLEHSTTTHASEGGRAVGVADANPVRKRRHGRLRGRVARWMSKARQAITRSRSRPRSCR
ncbi:predicted protein [Chaetomium globosum CBS 148.51]|uniref:Uncharacterized protein n=1 Tax=Chaetomium globosum (strain ATCC 6205 / CBS 148.51 / DSM 1962 / NBRC 6347 / NRRL 1970) TaxID=306901 RepID=Q2HFQ3_CHAGB|nr:uncharacterized protein CHGG_00951 [Chaetomium globosum CBS 148.51]EAQ92716.1 predicted protein [Chaetomium globosum CBS 148.51]